MPRILDPLFSWCAGLCRVSGWRWGQLLRACVIGVIVYTMAVFFFYHFHFFYRMLCTESPTKSTSLPDQEFNSTADSRAWITRNRARDINERNKFSVSSGNQEDTSKQFFLNPSKLSKLESLQQSMLETNTSSKTSFTQLEQQEISQGTKLLDLSLKKYGGYDERQNIRFKIPVHTLNANIQQEKRGVKDTANNNISHSDFNSGMTDKMLPLSSGSSIFPLTWLKKQNNVSIFVNRIIKSLRITRKDKFLSGYENYFVPRKELVNNFNPEFLIPAKEVCLSPDNRPILLVAVMSCFGDFAVRSVIRATWGRLAYQNRWFNKEVKGYSYKVRLVFVLGIKRVRPKKMQLVSESEKYKDIVLADFEDRYRNLSFKVATILKWVSTFCPGAGFVLKVDQDTVVHLPVLLDFLTLVHAGTPNARFVMGREVFRYPPYIGNQSRWKPDPDQYPLPFYPMYLFGHSYVISAAAIPDLLLGFHHLPVVKSEDAFFTGVIAKSVNVQRISSSYFAYEDGRGDAICDIILDKKISVTRVSVQAMFNVAKNRVTNRNCTSDNVLKGYPSP